MAGKARQIINAKQGTLIREAIRSVVVAASAFGLKWTAEQTAGVYFVTAAVLQLLVQWNERPAKDDA